MRRRGVFWRSGTARLRVALGREWWANHVEHCDNKWPHAPGVRCHWPPPPELEGHLPAEIGDLFVNEPKVQKLEQEVVPLRRLGESTLEHGPSEENKRLHAAAIKRALARRNANR